EPCNHNAPGITQTPNGRNGDFQLHGEQAALQNPNRWDLNRGQHRRAQNDSTLQRGIVEFSQTSRPLRLCFIQANVLLLSLQTCRLNIACILVGLASARLMHVRCFRGTAGCKWSGLTWPIEIRWHLSTPQSCRAHGSFWRNRNGLLLVYEHLLAVLILTLPFPGSRSHR